MKCGVWRVQCEVWGVKSAVWSVECEVWSVECEVWSGECAVGSMQWSVKCGLGRVQCEVRSVECEVWSVKSDLIVVAASRSHGRRYERWNNNSSMADGRRQFFLVVSFLCRWTFAKEIVGTHFRCWWLSLDAGSHVMGSLLLEICLQTTC